MGWYRVLTRILPISIPRNIRNCRNRPPAALPDWALRFPRKTAGQSDCADRRYARVSRRYSARRSDYAHRRQGVRNMTLNRAVQKMRGKAGTKVRLTIFRKAANRTFSLTLTRAEVHVQSVKTKLIQPAY